MRVDERLVKRHRLGARHLGVLLVIGGVVTATPLLALIAYPEESRHAAAFLAPAAFLVALGGLLWRFASPREVDVSLSHRQASVVVVMGWLVVLVVAAWPYAMALGLGPVAAFFEAVSGWTTTGLTVVDVTRAPKIVLLYRSITQLAGGAGFAIAALAVLGGPMGPGLAFAEGRTDRLHPTLRWSAVTVLSIYSGYVGAGILGLWAAGMSVFDAVNHAFAAVSTGGFSTRPESIGAWASPGVELVCVPLMIAGSTNFQIAYLIARGRFRSAFADTELRQAALLASLVVLGLFAALWLVGGGARGEGLQRAIFEGVSALTTTGFTTADHVAWPPLAMFLIIVAMTFGGSTGSTAGGLKQLRVHFLWRALVAEVRRALVPSRAVAVLQIHRGGRVERLEDRDIMGVVAVAVLYGLVLAVLVGVMAGYGYELDEAIYEAASSLGTVGLSLGLTSASTPPVVLVAQSVGMILGRLELLVVVVAIGRVAKDGRDLLKARRETAAARHR